MIVDTQNKEPEIKQEVDRVGIEGFKTTLEVSGKSGTFSHFPTIDVMIDLPAHRKGVHMSRLTEAINEVVKRKKEQPAESLERFGVEILNEIKKNHPYQRGEITITSSLVLEKVTPKTKRKSTENYDVKVKVLCNQEKLKKYLEVKVVGATACPHSYRLTEGKAHIQRAKITLGIWTDIDTILPLEKLIALVENVFSAPTFSLVKSEDEQFLVNEMYKNPKFVEDLSRECFKRVQNLDITGKVKIRAVSYESIHKHNAVSEIERKIEKI